MADLTEQIAIGAGRNAVNGRSETLDKYPIMAYANAIHLDFISLAIQMGARLDDLRTYPYETHPESAAANPSANGYVFAARDAFTAERDSYY